MSCSVLVFPPFDSRLRFLLHQLTAKYFPELKTVSVGREPRRQLLIYRMDQTKDVLCDPIKKSDSNNWRERKSRRPSQELYRPPSADSTCALKQPVDTHPPVIKGEKAEHDSSQVSKEAEEESWDQIYDDSGECLRPDLIQEFKDSVGISKDTQVNLKLIKGDFSAFETKEPMIGDPELPHVLEVYDFSPDLKTKDIFLRISSNGSVFII